MWTATLKVRACHFILHDSTKIFVLSLHQDQMFVGFPLTCCWKHYVQRVLQRLTNDLGEGNLGPFWGIIPVIVNSRWEIPQVIRTGIALLRFKVGDVPNASVLGNNCLKTLKWWMWSSTNCDFYIILRPVITVRRQALPQWKSPMWAMQ